MNTIACIARTALAAAFIAGTPLVQAAQFVVGDVLTDGGRGRGPRPIEMTLGPFARAMDAQDRRATASAPEPPRRVSESPRPGSPPATPPDEA